MKNITRDQILNLIIGLPPLAEQKRIVAKINELMSLCDELKSHIVVARALQQKIADVVVEKVMEY